MPIGDNFYRMNPGDYERQRKAYMKSKPRTSQFPGYTGQSNLAGGGSFEPTSFDLLGYPTSLRTNLPTPLPMDWRRGIASGTPFGGGGQGYGPMQRFDRYGSPVFGSDYGETLTNMPLQQLLGLVDQLRTYMPQLPAGWPYS